MPRDSFIYRGALVVGVLPAFFGLSAMLRPEATLTGAEFTVPQDPEARKLVFGLMRIYGVRNLSVSFLMAILWSIGNRKLFGLALFGGLAMCITDGFVSKAVVGHGEWLHWSFVPIVLGFSVPLLRGSG
ncbi:hypothetical protein NM208_g9697 [Fusarium decemcellulare]|uniref:Uncharacterized protein n=1 Tax=Fusarium decemcellulare TaxID=57161 RepID=A0ACC1S0N5_9HYPO|nr:hypothetical protein NM208_g9697 [Fusarium decemcellulare]